MSMYLGMRLGHWLMDKWQPRLPLWARVLIGVVSLGSLLFLIYLALCLLSQQNHYKRLQDMAHRVFQAEEAYYVEYGKFTANLDKLGITLPGVIDEQYDRGGYVYDNGQKVETPQVYTAQTEKGDSIIIQVMGTEDDPNALNLPTALEINVFAKPGKLPASYAIRYFFGEDNPFGRPLFQCNVLTRNPFWGGNLCRRMGVEPTDVPSTWIWK